MNERKIQLLQEYKQLNYDWNFEDAVAPSLEPILLAEYIVKAMEKKEQKVFHVAPGPRGEITSPILYHLICSLLIFVLFHNSPKNFL